MNISFNWLKDYLKFDLTAEQVGAILTSTGLEVEHMETVEQIAGGLAGVIVAEVVECIPHPDSDHLQAGQNTEKAMELEGFSSIYERLFTIEKDLAFAEINGNTESLIALEKEQKEITIKVQKMLKTIGLTLNDLSPKYMCDKCNDTGYVGTNRCDCFDKFLDKN